MRRVIRRNVTRNPAGIPIASDSEQLTDNGQGLLNVVTERTARFCSGCRRPVVELSELRGTCDWCRMRGCCTQCESRCHLCARRLCGQCRRGFAASSMITVCIECQQRLVARQAMEDRLAAERLRFDREMALLQRQRQDHADQKAEQIAQQKFEFETQLQLARLRLDAGLPLIPKPLFRRILEGGVSVVARLFQLP